MEELDFHLRHVDARRALAPASLAGDAEIERRVERVRGERVGAQLARESEPQRIGATARDMLLLARRAVGRAHHAGIELAAMAVVVAHLDRLGEALAGARPRVLVLRPVEGRADRDRPVARRIAVERAVVLL
jgi:hypothetical protein